MNAHSFMSFDDYSLMTLPVKRNYGGGNSHRVGAPRFELGASCSRSKRSTRLSYAPARWLCSLDGAH